MALFILEPKLTNSTHIFKICGYQNEAKRNLLKAQPIRVNFRFKFKLKILL